MSKFPNKFVIGLTGNIAVGKSLVRQMLQHLGAYPIDADALVHQAMAPGAPAYRPIIEAFGQFILNPDKTINRAALGSIAFGSPDAMQRLEAVTHPIVRQAVTALVQRAKQRVIVIEAIKLLEGELAKTVDAVWVVNAKPETQYRRLIAKRKLSPDEAKKRILSQGSQAAKVKQANWVVENDGDVEATWRQVQKGWQTVAASLARQAIPTQPGEVSPYVDTTPIRLEKMGTGALATKEEFVVRIRRGMPGNADQIAAFLTLMTKRSVSRMDIMLAFGQKSYLLAESATEQLIGVLGWQVENLITRCNELHILPATPVKPVVDAFVDAVEQFSRELESEVGYFFLDPNTSTEIQAAFSLNGYKPTVIGQIPEPSWREAIVDSGAAQSLIMEKRLRKDRVLKPI